MNWFLVSESLIKNKTIPGELHIDGERIISGPLGPFNTLSPTVDDSAVTGEAGPNPQINKLDLQFELGVDQRH